MDADPGAGAGTLLVVCRANLIRSPLAAGLLRGLLTDVGEDRTTVESAGLRATDGAVPPEDAVRVARRWGVDLSAHRSVAVGPALIARASIVVTMTEEQRTSLTRSAPLLVPRTFTLRELVRLLGPRPAGRATCSALADRAHRRRPTSDGPAGDEDVPDPVGRGLRCLEEVAEDIAGLCSGLARWWGGPGP